MALVDLPLLGLSTSTILTLIIVACILLLVVKSYRQRNVVGEAFEAKLPPGPPGLPVLGNIPYCCTEPWAQKQVEIYGDIFTFQMGSLPIIYLHGKALKDALNFGNLLSNRAPVPAMREFFQDRGIIGATFEGFWKTQRSFATRFMHKFQMGTTRGQDSILSEVDKLVKFLRKQGGTGFDPSATLQLATANIIGAFVFGHQFEYDDAFYLKMIENMRTCLQTLSYRCVVMFFPRISRLPYIGLQAFYDYFDMLIAQQREEINQHKENLDRNNPKDFIDHYLLEMEKPEAKDGGFTQDSLEITLTDLFIAGTETSAGTIVWCFLQLALHPDIQIKVQQELDTVIPQEQDFVTMNDQHRCVYVQAVINETQRFGSIAPFSMRATPEDTVYGEYRIPKGTFFLADYAGTMHSPRLWNNPNDFKPERFLSKQEPVTLVKQEFLLPFSTGRRNCFGERLARAELFLFIANLYRQFNIRFPHGTPRPSSAPSVGLTRIPKPFKVCFIPRQKETHVDTLCSDQS